MSSHSYQSTLTCAAFLQAMDCPAQLTIKINMHRMLILIVIMQSMTAHML